MVKDNGALNFCYVKHNRWSSIHLNTQTNSQTKLQSDKLSEISRYGQLQPTIICQMTYSLNKNWLNDIYSLQLCAFMY